MRSAGLNYQDVLAQIRLPVYAHNAVRNVQSMGNHPPATSSAFAIAVTIAAAAAAVAFRGGRDGGGRAGEGIRTYVSAYAVCVFRGWAHIDRYVLPVAR